MGRLLAGLLLASIAFLPLGRLGPGPVSAESLATTERSAALEEGTQEPTADQPEHDVVPVTLWSVAGVAVGAIVLAALYLLKRRLGGFPENPSWVAPISIEPSSTFADEQTWAGVTPSAHGDAHH